MRNPFIPFVCQEPVNFADPTNVFTEMLWFRAFRPLEANNVIFAIARELVGYVNGTTQPTIEDVRESH
jgi:hypothetical protein